eukprot:TRINITY_DN19389_c0_g1_i1.p1 TRINITY_DN19389_c0_g1~~TRINITY_DN19389_c0_g1_i1.p1  ORF type:complete len:229 (-),score=34.45 TRINITY_DN19389_c0_g1_i1:371-1057(-)
MCELSSYHRGTGVSVFSSTLAGWTRGTVVDTDENGHVVVHYSGPDKQLLEKRFPPGHCHLRIEESLSVGEVQMGCQVEVYSSTLQDWTLGTVVETDAQGLIVVQYTDFNGRCLQKSLPVDHQQVRMFSASPCSTFSTFSTRASSEASSDEETVRTPRDERKPRRKNVKFSEDAPSIHHVQAYCDHYGVHPALFDFDAQGKKLVAACAGQLKLRLRSHKGKWHNAANSA